MAAGVGNTALLEHPGPEAPDRAELRHLEELVGTDCRG